MELRQAALDALCAADPDTKVRLTRGLSGQAAALPVADLAPPASLPVPGRPDKPALVHPAKVPRRSPFKPEGLAALLHAIAHIEFNAINLAADAAWRFDGMPREFYLDWVRVAREEAYHFTLLREHLQSLGYGYGDFPAHDNLWSMCEKTAGDVVRAHGARAAHARSARARRHAADPAQAAAGRHAGRDARGGDSGHHP